MQKSYRARSGGWDTRRSGQICFFRRRFLSSKGAPYAGSFHSPYNAERIGPGL